MIGSHAGTFIGDAASVSLLVGSLIVLMTAAARRDRADARRAARRARSPYAAMSHVRRLPR